ncbi:MAG: NADPH-dependent 7-cyano-7-deazaguanine reductase QueF [Woeseiaceae bacterium]|nr:NADPH-dependent 7-cyano-7-deazaguanine reductase QueF [Woeseiaceae bacterium]
MQSMTEEIPLGRAVPFPEQYSPELLFRMSREQQRERLGLAGDPPFHGTDIWNAWELTWLDHYGKPMCATAEIRVPADSPCLIESKSLKLYLNSFAMTHCLSRGDVVETIQQDLSDCAGTDVDVSLSDPASGEDAHTASLPGDCLDSAKIKCSYERSQPDAALLQADTDDIVTEQLYSDLLRSLCPVTSQPDMGSILVSYSGPRIDREALLRYIVSYRQHEDFHESCVEQMFIDILDKCAPEKLTVYARYNRRGGIDINPFRSNFEADAPNPRLWRQ